MAVHLYNTSQTLLRAMPLLVAGGAVLTLPEAKFARDIIIDTYEGIVHPPKLALPKPKSPNKLLLFTAVGGFLYALSRYSPELRGTIPQAAKDLSKSRSSKPKTRRVPATKKLIPEDLLKKLDVSNRQSAENQERLAIAQYNSDYTRNRKEWWQPLHTKITEKGEGAQKATVKESVWNYRPKTQEEKAEHQKIAKAIKAYLDYKYNRD